MNVEKLFDASQFEAPYVNPERLEFPSDQIAEQRIWSALDKASIIELEAGTSWYFEAHELCLNWLKRYSVGSETHVAGIIAALSPMKTWSGNIISARKLLETGECRGLGYSVRDAMAIYDGAHPRDILCLDGRNNTKVRSFFENISDPINPDFVTIDRHMIGLLTNDPLAIRNQRWILPRDHVWAKERFQNVADQTDLIPNQVQAITWLVWRRNNGIVDNSTSGQLPLFDFS